MKVELRRFFSLFLLASSFTVISPVVAEPVSEPVTPEQVTIKKESPEAWKRVRLSRTIKAYDSLVQSLKFSPDGEFLTSGGNQNEPILKVWSVKTGKMEREIRAQRTGIRAIAISPDGRTIASTGFQAGINIWNMPSFENPTFFLDKETAFSSLLITPDSQILVSAGLEGIRLWSLVPRRPLYTLTGYGAPVYAMAINANGYVLASGEDSGRVKFWNIRDGKLISEFYPHKERITALAFNPKGNILITGSTDRTIKVWDLVTRKLLYTLEGHSALIRDLAVHPNGQVLASASNDGIRLWNIQNGDFLNLLTRGTDWVECISFSPNGKILASGSYDSTINFWEVIPPKAPEVIKTP